MAAPRPKKTLALLASTSFVALSLVAAPVSLEFQLDQPAPASAQDLTYNLGIYQGLSARERTFARYTVQRTLETKRKHQSGRWDDPLNGTLGLVTPLRTDKSTTGHYCREFMEAVTRKVAVRSALQ